MCCIPVTNFEIDLKCLTKIFDKITLAQNLIRITLLIFSEENLNFYSQQFLYSKQILEFYLSNCHYSVFAFINSLTF